MGKNSILLIGMPGCGKTTIGKILANQMNYNFYDMDKYIEDISGKKVKELFDVSEENFREWETKACEELSKKRRAIISSGGGVVKNKKNIDLFKEESIIIFINREVEDILSDVDTKSRPLLKDGEEKIYSLYNERINLYNEYSDTSVLNKGFLKDVINSLENKLRIEYGLK